MSARVVDILFVRHPETEANINGRFVGQGESAYTPEGLRQARRLPAKIAAFEPGTIWTSPLLRARVVAERAARIMGAPLVVEPRLIELDFGAAHALTWEEAQAAGIRFDYRSFDGPVAPGGESRRQLQERVGAAVDDACEQGGRHAFVCHAGVMRAAFGHALRLTPDQLWMFAIHNAQLAHVRFVDGTAMLVEYRQG